MRTSSVAPAAAQSATTRAEAAPEVMGEAAPEVIGVACVPVAALPQTRNGELAS